MSCSGVRGKARQGEARRGKARQQEARRGEARQEQARRGTGDQRLSPDPQIYNVRKWRRAGKPLHFLDG